MAESETGPRPQRLRVADRDLDQAGTVLVSCTLHTTDRPTQTTERSRLCSPLAAVTVKDMSTTYEKLEWRHYAAFVDGQRVGEAAFVAGRSGRMWFAPALVQPDRSDRAYPTRLQAVNAPIRNHRAAAANA